MSFELQRHPANPLLSARDGGDWDGGLVFNGAVAQTDDGVFHMLYRAAQTGFVRRESVTTPTNVDEYDGFISRIGHAISVNGVDWKPDSQPALDINDEFDCWGAEDPRITRVDDTFYIFYTGVTQPAYTGYDHIRVCMATTKDFVTYTKHGVVGPARMTKGGWLFPRKINDSCWLALVFDGFAPDSSTFMVPIDDVARLGNITDDEWNALLADPANNVLATGRRWSDGQMPALGFETGPGALETPHGWLWVHARIDIDPPRWSIAAVLLDRDDPRKVTHELRAPILTAHVDYERNGFVRNVCFPQGHAVVNGEYRLYYGAADQSVCLATCSLDDLVAALLLEPL
jgi:predicted GH43/DUF377 family glycosyl hydrolase